MAPSIPQCASCQRCTPSNCGQITFWGSFEILRVPQDGGQLLASFALMQPLLDLGNDLQGDPFDCSGCLPTKDRRTSNDPFARRRPRASLGLTRQCVQILHQEKTSNMGLEEVLGTSPQALDSSSSVRTLGTSPLITGIELSDSMCIHAITPAQGGDGLGARPLRGS